MTRKPTTWFGIITERGRPRALTIAMFTLIAIATVVSVFMPAASTWMFVCTALVGAAWYRHMSGQYRAARRRASSIDD